MRSMAIKITNEKKKVVLKTRNLKIKKFFLRIEICKIKKKKRYAFIFIFLRKEGWGEGERERESEWWEGIIY